MLIPYKPLILSRCRFRQIHSQQGSITWFSNFNLDIQQAINQVTGPVIKIQYVPGIYRFKFYQASLFITLDEHALVVISFERNGVRIRVKKSVIFYENRNLRYAAQGSIVFNSKSKDKLRIIRFDFRGNKSRLRRNGIRQYNKWSGNLFPFIRYRIVIRRVWIRRVQSYCISFFNNQIGTGLSHRRFG